MERFFKHHERHIELSPAAQRFFLKHSRVLTYPRNAFFMRPDERMPYWCMVLEGLACGYTLDEEGLRRIHWFALPNQGFTGVRHLYTPSKAGHYIQFLQDSAILRIPALRMRQAKEQFPEVSEFLHILKQQYIDRNDQLKIVLQQSTAYMRYAHFAEFFPELVFITTPEQQADFINVGRTRFFHARKRWLRERGR